MGEEIVGTGFVKQFFRKILEEWQKNGFDEIVKPVDFTVVGHTGFEPVTS